MLIFNLENAWNFALFSIKRRLDFKQQYISKAATKSPFRQHFTSSFSADNSKSFACIVFVAWMFAIIWMGSMIYKTKCLV